MKTKIFTLTLLLFAIRSQAQFNHMNVELLGIFNDSTVLAEPVYGIRYQACWGWADSSGREYGILGSTAGTYIIEVTDPTLPVMRDYVPGRQNECIWHEYKTYQNYLYIISDDGGINSFQIADLTYLPDSVHVVYDSTDIFVHAHTLYIDGDKLYVGSVTTTTSFSSMNVYSLSDPTHPTLLRQLEQDYPGIGSVHDMFVVNDTVYASCGYQGMFIYLYDSVANEFVQLGSITSGVNNYNHSSFISPDHNTLYVCEEVPDGRPVSIVDVNDIANPSLVDTFYSHQGATPHNPVVIDNLLIVAYYQDGVYIYNIDNPTAPVLTGYFDTYPFNPPGVFTQPAYAGAWSAYPDLPSGILLVGDMQSGLFCLNISDANGIEDYSTNSLKIFPNPSTARVMIPGLNHSKVEICDYSGRMIKTIEEVSGDYTMDVTTLPAGYYVVRTITGNRVSSGKLLIMKN